MDSAKLKKKGEQAASTQKEVEIGYKHYLPNRKIILSKLKAKKRYSHKHSQKQKSQETPVKGKSKLTRPKEAVPAKEAPPPNRDSIAQFYRQERKKLNIWTYLFQKLYTSFNQILKMSEIEKKLEFCRGIEETLGNFLSETRKVSQWVEVEGARSRKSTAWEIRATPNKEPELDRIDERRVDVQFDDRGQVEFKLLSELVTGGKMTFYEAIVLIIRERAILFDMLADAPIEPEYTQADPDGSLASRSSLMRGVLSGWHGRTNRRHAETAQQGGPEREGGRDEVACLLREQHRGVFEK